MKTQPILLNTEMVQAEQAGKKTQTRRTKGLDAINVVPEMWRFTGFNDKGQACFESDEIRGAKITCPYGQKGDALWVRETWNDYVNDIPLGYILYKADMPVHWDAKDTEHGEDVDLKSEDFKWKPSIHMPRSACRTILEIVNIRVEQVHDISESDAESEGVYREWDGTHYWHKNYLTKKLFQGHPTDRASTSFFTLWESINGKRGMGWEHNPWVWVVEFKRCENT